MNYDNDSQNTNFQGKVNNNLMKNIQKPEDNKKPAKKKRRIIRYIGLFILITLLPLIAKYIAIWVSAEKKIKYELQRFEDDGISLNVEDYAPAPVADDENAATILAEAFKKLTDNEKIMEKLQNIIYQYPGCEDVGFDSIKDYINEHAEHIEIVKQAIKHPKCRYNIDYSSDLNDVPHINKIMQLVKIILCQSQFFINEENQEKAIEYLLLGMQLARTLRDEPHLISQTILLISHEFVTHIIKHMLDKFTLTDDQCQRLIDEINNHMEFAYGKSLIVEFLLSHKYFYKGVCDGDVDPNLGRNLWFYLPALRKLDYGIILERLHDEIDLQTMPLGASKLLEADMVKLKWKTYDFPNFAFLSMAYFPLYGEIENDSTLRLARLEMARAALAIQIYYNRIRRLPKTLAELVEQKILNKEPVDPFKEDVLTYLKIDEKTYKLYTISTNLTDDGGEPIDEFNLDDYTWHLTLPK